KDINVVEAVFEYGCDDATSGTLSGLRYADCAREASTFADAVLTAIDQVEHVDHLSVRRVESDDVVAAADMAERSDPTRESIRLLIDGTRARQLSDADLAWPRARTHRAMV